MLARDSGIGKRVQEVLRFPATIVETVAAFTGARRNTRASYRATSHIWSRGLALLCDHNGGFDYVRKQRGGGREALRFDASDYARIRDGDLVWVRVSSLPDFVERILPNINARFALVTGDEDWAIPSGFIGSENILSNPNVLCWFAQNYDGTDVTGKIHPIPIGVDFHTIANRRRWKHWQATPAHQAAELDRIRAGMLTNSARRARAHADFHLNPGRAMDEHSRASLYAKLATNPCIDFQARKLSRHALWREKTRYAFVVSPHGHGLDCHRTWESLLLGNIPIVKRSSLDELYEGLPVVIVDDFSEISADALARWHREFRNLFGLVEVQERLANRFWIDRMRRAVGDSMNA